MKKRKKFEMKVSRRKFLKIGFAGGAAMFIPWRFKLPTAMASNSRRHAGSTSCTQVPDADADPAGNAPSRDH